MRLAHYFNNCGFYDVLAMGRDEVKGKELIDRSIPFQAIDLANSVKLSELKWSPKFIVHAAGFAAPWGTKKQFYVNNVTATKNLLDFAWKKNVKRFIFISSSSVYSSLNDQFNVRENHIPFRFISRYGQSKYLAEQAVMDAARKGLPVIILRPRAVIGTGDTNLLPRLIQAHQQRRLRKVNKDAVMSDVTTITNLIEAVQVSLSSNASATANVFNITDGKPLYLWPMIDGIFEELGFPPLEKELSWRSALVISAMSEMFSRMSGRDPLLSRYLVSTLGTSLTLNIDKARRLLNYRPLQTSEQGLREYLQDFKKSIKHG